MATVFVFWLCFLLCVSSIDPAISACNRTPVIFTFGDSNSDTGGLAAGLGIPINPPYGRDYFGRPAGRLSDGRLVVDFLCQNLNTSLLTAYLDSLGSKFPNGANFAIVGATVLPKFVPFVLNIQVLQFLHFKAKSLELITAGWKDTINEEGFRNALYIIDIGQNDLANSFSNGLSYDQVIERIPLVISEIMDAVKTIYYNGGKKFWIHNTGPLGCLPQKLSMAGTNSTDVDPHGCISSYNTAARRFNEELLQSCQNMISELSDATIIYVDIYSIKYGLIENSTQYGFPSPLMASCGYGGPPYNYNASITCGNPGSHVSDEGSRFISWDGVHYTEAANSIVASKILSTVYSTPQTPFDFFCQ